jgi:serine phosphatase RsbU (regulator of sigma subunit)
MFGEERLHRILIETTALSGAALSDRLLRDVQSHSGRSEFEDDVCLVAIESR